MTATVVVGHRGAGKTSFLRRAEAYFAAARRPIRAVDLDEVVASREGRSIERLFSERGEQAFRALEARHFAGLARAAASSPRPCLIAVGAGWQGPVPDGWRCLWIRRETDADGRVFLDRPRLEPAAAPLDEYRRRFEDRQARYRAWATDVLTVPEGMDRPNAVERDRVLGRLRRLGGIWTVLPGHRAERLRELLASGVSLLEVRDDLLDRAALERAAGIVPDGRLLLSLRDPRRTASTRKLIVGRRALWDWPIERGPCSWGQPAIASLHTRPANVALAACLRKLDRWDDGRTLLKAALPVRSFGELLEGEAWRLRDPGRRAFLPVSADGRWSWYRLLLKGSCPLNFLREEPGAAADQPVVLAWACAPERPAGGPFAAVLGDPVRHSRSPAEHHVFFARLRRPFTAVRMTEADWRQGGLEALRELGLTWAAVTSPLKKAAFAAARRSDRTTRSFGAANSLAWDKGWAATNTDLAGLEAHCGGLTQEETAVWGGGGTLSALRRLLPRARFFSSRSGRLREASNARPFLPASVVWAAPRRPRQRWPSASWRPRAIIDLDYREDSAGREYALRSGAAYVSGFRLFRAQAREQRKFWRKHVR